MLFLKKYLTYPGLSILVGNREPELPWPFAEVSFSDFFLLC